MAVRLDWCPVSRLEELQAFIDEHWRPGHVLSRDAELLRWQHRRPDDPERLSVLLAEDGTRIVGMLGFVAFDACVRGERAAGGWMTNWLVLPELRGQGVGIGLVRRALDREYELIGALAGNANTQRVLGSFGFAEVGMPRWVRVLSAKKLEDLLAGRDGGYPAEAWSAWRAQAEREPAPAAADGRVVAWRDEIRAEWDEAWDTRFAPGLVGACRSSAYLSRRYLEHPDFRYKLLVAEDARGPAGLAAYRVEGVKGSDARVLRIVDFLADGAAGRLLAGALAEAGREAGAVFADFYCTSYAFGAPLEEAGFELEDRLPAQLPGRFQPLDFSDRPMVCSFWIAPRLGADSRDFFRTPALYVVRSDSDLDRPN